MHPLKFYREGNNQAGFEAQSLSKDNEKQPLSKKMRGFKNEKNKLKIFNFI